MICAIVHKARAHGTPYVKSLRKTGTVIRNNLIHATGKGVDACGSHGIYMDDYTSGITIDRNIVVSVGVGVTSCGLSNRVENNLAINTRKPAFQISSRGIDSFARKTAAKGTGSYLINKLLAQGKKLLPVEHTGRRWVSYQDCAPELR